MARILDKAQLLMQARWAASIPRRYRYDPRRWHSKGYFCGLGEIVLPRPGADVVKAWLADLLAATRETTR